MIKNLKAFIIILMITLGYVWMLHYEKQTIKLEQQVNSIETKLNTINENVKYNDYRITYPEYEYLDVPDKPINYWENEPIYKENKNISYKANIKAVEEYIKSKEGFHATPYRDGCLIKAKVCPKSKYRYSNGYGTPAKSKTEKISKVEAEKRLRNHINNTIWPKIKNVNFESIHQFYASIDFAYNIGHNAFANNIVNNNEVNCARMTNYINFNGKENEGLKQRRLENFLNCVRFDDEQIALNK